MSDARVRHGGKRRVKLFGANNMRRKPRACIRVRCELVRRRAVNEPSIETVSIGLFNGGQSDRTGAGGSLLQDVPCTYGFVTPAGERT